MNNNMNNNMNFNQQQGQGQWQGQQQKEVILYRQGEELVKQILTKEYSVIGLIVLMFYFMFGIFGIFGGAIFIGFTHNTRKNSAWGQVRGAFIIKEEMEQQQWEQAQQEQQQQEQQGGQA